MIKLNLAMFLSLLPVSIIYGCDRPVRTHSTGAIETCVVVCETKKIVTLKFNPEKAYESSDSQAELLVTADKSISNCLQMFSKKPEYGYILWQLPSGDLAVSYGSELGLDNPGQKSFLINAHQSVVKCLGLRKEQPANGYVFKRLPGCLLELTYEVTKPTSLCSMAARLWRDCFGRNQKIS